MNQQSTVVSYEDMSKQIDLVFDKIMTLIKYNVWSNVSIERFKRWKAQFKSDEERYYAAYLAQKLVFYNKKDFISLISYSFSISIKQITLLEIENKEEMNDIIWRDKIEVTRRNTLVCPLTTDSAASGFMVARLLRDQGIISENELMDSHDDLIRTVRRRNTMLVCTRFAGHIERCYNKITRGRVQLWPKKNSPLSTKEKSSSLLQSEAKK